MPSPKKTLMSLVMALSLTTAMAAPALMAAPAEAATKAELSTDAPSALNRLYASNATAKLIGSRAKAVLVFPNIVKAGLVFGGAYGEGVLMTQGQADAYYNSFSGSWGLQAGAQSYGYAVFLMNDNAIKYLKDTQGWEVGVGPTVVVVDEGIAKNLSTSTLKDDAYAVIFNQQGLMAGVTIEGTKISKIKE
ncbi:MAG: twin-arginine translocation pathway signal protein [Asticcacaulis sp. 32-58-5]|nr:MAG: twin-arginine translocation pathway signal protein [Asticcacaulis sp. 32-58-5]